MHHALRNVPDAKERRIKRVDAFQHVFACADWARRVADMNGARAFDLARNGGKPVGEALTEVADTSLGDVNEPMHVEATARVFDNPDIGGRFHARPDALRPAQPRAKEVVAEFFELLADELRRATCSREIDRHELIERRFERGGDAYSVDQVRCGFSLDMVADAWVRVIVMVCFYLGHLYY